MWESLAALRPMLRMRCVVLGPVGLAPAAPGLVLSLRVPAGV